jgi:ABC-type amino acid transport substrate-binding protein
MLRLPAFATTAAAAASIVCLTLSCLAPATAAPPLRTAAQDNNTIKFNLKGKRKGICVDVFQAIERIEPGLRFTGWDQPMSLPRVESALAENQLDVFCALIRTPARAAKFNFIDVPVYTVRHRIAVRADDDVQVRNLDDIRKLGPGNVVLVLKGTAHEEMLRRYGGLALDASAQNLDVNLRKLQHGRGRFLYHTENALLRYIDKEKLGGQIKLLPAVLKEDNLLFAVSRSLPAATADMLRGALQQLADRGELKKIYANYKAE